jgi:hypothetical protein
MQPEKIPTPLFVWPQGMRTDHRYNLDGVLIWEEGSENPCPVPAYVQIFRNGSFEAVGALDNALAKGQVMPKEFPENLGHLIKGYVKDLRDIGVVPPVVVMVSLLRVKGFMLYKDFASAPFAMQLAGGNNRPFDRDTILLPEILLEDLQGDMDVNLKPVLDALCRASGWSKYAPPAPR